MPERFLSQAEGDVQTSTSVTSLPGQAGNESFENEDTSENHIQFATYRQEKSGTPQRLSITESAICRFVTNSGIYSRATTPRTQSSQ